MERRKRFSVLGVVAAVLVLAGIGLQVWLWKTPLVVIGRDKPGGTLFDGRTAAGRAFMSVQECGERQQDLYGCIRAFVEKNGRVPNDMNELINEVHEAMAFDDCPAALSGYVVHFENYGKPDAVVIEEHKNKHPTAFALWIRGYHPRVQTLGDGTVHLFADAKLATIPPEKDN